MSNTSLPLRRQRERQKQLVKISKTNTLHVHHAILYISLPSLHNYDVNSLISRFIDKVNIRRRISLSRFKLGHFLKNSTPGEFAYTKHSDRVGIIALKFNRSRSHFLRDVFAPLAVVASLTPYCLTDYGQSQMVCSQQLLLRVLNVNWIL